jgi:hypothetical protein
MHAESMRRREPVSNRIDRIDWDGVITFALCFGLVAFLGFDGGGYDPLVHSQVGIAIWWVLLLGVAVRALPRLRLPPLALAAIGLFAAFAIWTALSLIWTGSAERTATDLARVLTYLGLFSLVMATRAPREPRRVVSAVAAAIAFVTLLGLLSRLHPAWFPSADQTARFLGDSRERLSYPLNYWNGLGALIGIGVPLVLDVAATARRAVVRGLAAAALPGMMLALVFTLSRGGIAAAAIAFVVYLAIAGDRVPKLLVSLVAGAGAAVLVAYAVHREALRLGLGSPLAHHQGNEVLLVGLIISALVGLLAVAVTVPLRGERRPAWTRPSRQVTLAGVGAAAVLIVVALIAVNAPHRFSHAVDEFKGGGNAGAGTSRLNSFAGESRYALWKSALKENASAPILGTGSGTFEFWWDRKAGGTEAVHDAHSLYLQTLGELGIVGMLILAAFLLSLLGGGIRALIRAGPEARPHLAAAFAGCLSFCLSAAIDWTWQIPVLPATLFILGSTLVVAGAAERAEESTTEIAHEPAAERGGEPPAERGVEPAAEPARGPARERTRAGLSSIPARVALAIGALIAIVAIAIPFASADLVRQSENDVRAGDLAGALENARSARSVEPGASTPRLQEALVLELDGQLPEASTAAQEASERESTNWRPWLVISRIEAKRGNAAASLAAYRKARSLYPLSPLFKR